jgi:hypothetical protein
MDKDAVLSDSRTYRYALWRIWDKNKPYAMLIGLNPSTADEIEDDPTTIRCIQFAKSWGYGGLCMTNLFAFRATKPTDMKKALDPVGSGNDQWLIKLANDAGVVVGAWGNDGGYQGRAEHVIALIPDMSYLKLNKTGHPTHPLYLRADLKPRKLIP